LIWLTVIARLSARKAVAISIFKKEIYLANEFLFLREIATPDRFSGQARNDKTGALPPKMTKNPSATPTPLSKKRELKGIKYVIVMITIVEELILS
jgi:hypothetical protein